MKAISKVYSAKVHRQNWPVLVKGNTLPLLGKALGIKIDGPLDAMITTGIFKKWRTIYNNTAGTVNGDSPIKNWDGSLIDYPSSSYQKLNPDRILERETGKYHCYSCVLGCGEICDISDLVPESKPFHKPKYETNCAFRRVILNDDLDSIYIINDRCNRGGIHTISAGHAVAFTIETFERELIGLEYTGGIEPRWGDSRAALELIDKIIFREGIGNLLADGTKRAADRLGPEAAELSIHA